MSITANSTALASDFVSTSSGSGDSGKVAKLNANGRLADGFMRFGGTGADGALAISSGVTTINLGGAAVFIKNYSSISITGTAQLAFSNPHANGTIIILKCQGNCTISSSTSPAIDASGMGADGASSAQNSGSQGNSNTISFTNPGTGGTHGAGAATAGAAVMAVNNLATGFYKVPPLFCGAGGGSGSNSVSGGDTISGGAGAGSLVSAGTNGGTTSGTGTGSGLTPASTGGKGGGALMLEVAGTYTCSSTLSVAGKNGSTSVTGNISSGGGGAGGSLVVLYGTLGSDSGTYTVSGGTGGSSGTNIAAGGNGASGYSYRGVNTELA